MPKLNISSNLELPSTKQVNLSLNHENETNKHDISLPDIALSKTGGDGKSLHNTNNIKVNGTGGLDESTMTPYVNAQKNIFQTSTDREKSSVLMQTEPKINTGNIGSENGDKNISQRMYADHEVPSNMKSNQNDHHGTDTDTIEMLNTEYLNDTGPRASENQ